MYSMVSLRGTVLYDSGAYFTLFLLSLYTTSIDNIDSFDPQWFKSFGINALTGADVLKNIDPQPRPKIDPIGPPLRSGDRRGR
jgi:hypothetical protein